MSAIIKLPADYKPHHFQFDRSYLPIKSKDRYVFTGRYFAIYKEEPEPGIYTIGLFLNNEAINTRKIPKEERAVVYRPSFKQVPFDVFYATYDKPLVSSKILAHFPTWRNKESPPLINEFVLYYTNRGAYELLDFFKIFAYREGPLYFSIEDWKYGIHKLRESSLPFRTKVALWADVKHCRECGLKNPGIFNFFEAHERLDLNFDGPYQPVEPKNFEILCPSCHKIKDNLLRFGDLNPAFRFYGSNRRD